MDKNTEKIYVVNAIYADELTKEDNEKEFEIYKIRYEIWKNKTFEEFLNFQRGYKKDKWNIGGFDSSYHTTKEEAIKFITENIGDINEAGCYNYASVSPIPMGCAYYNSRMNKNDIVLFKWNKGTHRYEIFNKTTENSELYNGLISYVWGFISAG